MEKEKVVLLIKENGGLIKDYKAKESILKAYCVENNYEVSDIIKYEEDEVIHTFYIELINLIREKSNSHNKIIMFDYCEIASSISQLYVILEMLSDYRYFIETVCDGRYSVFGTDKFFFDVSINNESELKSKLGFENYEEE